MKLKQDISISELLVLKKIYNCEFVDFFSGLPSPEMIMLEHEKE